MLSTRPRQQRIALAVVVTAAVAALGTSMPGTRASASAGDPYSSLTGTVQLSSDLLGGLDKVTLVGPVAAAQRVAVGVALKRPDPAGENAYIADVYNSASPNYRHFLDPAGLQARFGLPPPATRLLSPGCRRAASP